MFSEKQLRSARTTIKKAQVANRQRWDSEAHCVNGHPWAENKVLRIRSFGVHRQCRQCARNSELKYKKSSKVNRVVIERVIQALDEGQTLSRVCGGMKGKSYIGGKIIDIGKLKLFCASNPKLGNRIMKRAELNRSALYREVGERRRILAAPAILRNDGHALMGAIARVTRNLPRFIRDEVTSQICLEAAEGRLKIADVPERVKAFVSKHNSQYGGFVPVIGGFMYSLDKKLNEDGGSTTLGDIVSEGLWG